MAARLTHDPAQFFAGHPRAFSIYRKALATISGFGEVDVRTSKSYVAFRRRVAFSWIWLPGKWLRHPASETVVSIALPRQVHSKRFKETAHPTAKRWIHHLETASATDIDREVARWLEEAYEHAG